MLFRSNSQSRRGNKHVEDFLICYNAIKSHLDFTPDIQLWIEDDVVLMENFFSTLSSILAFRKPILSTSTWLDIKLYKTPRLRGYAWDFQPLTELVSTALLFAFVMNTIFLKVCSNTKFSARLLILFICFLITLKAISR